MEITVLERVIEPSSLVPYYKISTGLVNFWDVTRVQYHPSDENGVNFEGVIESEYYTFHVFVTIQRQEQKGHLSVNSVDGPLVFDDVTAQKGDDLYYPQYTLTHILEDGTEITVTFNPDSVMSKPDQKLRYYGNVTISELQFEAELEINQEPLMATIIIP